TDVLIAENLDTEAADLLDLFLDDVARQAEFGDALIHHAARRRMLFEHRRGVPVKREFARRGKAGRSAADDRHGLAGFRIERLEHDKLVPAMIGRRTLGKTYRYRFAQALATVAANVLAGSRAHAAENGGKYVVHQIDEIGLGVVALVDLAEI